MPLSPCDKDQWLDYVCRRVQITVTEDRRLSLPKTCESGELYLPANRTAGHFQHTLSRRTMSFDGVRIVYSVCGTAETTVIFMHARCRTDPSGMGHTRFSRSSFE